MKPKLEIKNQHALAVYLLWEKYSEGVTQADACKDFFYKFNTRLGELELTRGDKLKISRLWITKKNRFNHPCTFLRYKSNANRKYLFNLIAYLNKHGFKGSQNKK